MAALLAGRLPGTVPVHSKDSHAKAVKRVEHVLLGSGNGEASLRRGPSAEIAGDVFASQAWLLCIGPCWPQLCQEVDNNVIPTDQMRRPEYAASRSEPCSRAPPQC